MKKLFLLLSGVVSRVDVLHDRITSAYNLWGTVYGFILSLRGDLQSVPVPEAVRGPEPSPVVPAVRVLPDEAFAQSVL
jgi:hypothetical protein